MSQTSTTHCHRAQLQIAITTLFVLTGVSSASRVAAQSPEADKADPPAAQQPPSLDLLDGLDVLLEKATRAEPKASDPEKPKTTDPAADAEPGDAMLKTLQAVDLELQRAIQGLGNGDAGLATQTAQRRALEMLQTIVDQQSDNADQQRQEESQRTAQQQASQPGEQKPSSDPSGQDQQPQQRMPGAQPGSEAGSNPGVIVNAGPSQGMREAVWGHLPERVRGELQATLPEKYLPQYRDAISEYFRQLSTTADANR